MKSCLNSHINAEFYQPGLTISQSNLHFKYGELKKATGNFSQSNKLGQGSYGTVYKVFNVPHFELLISAVVRYSEMPLFF